MPGLAPPRPHRVRRRRTYALWPGRCWSGRCPCGHADHTFTRHTRSCVLGSWGSNPSEHMSLVLRNSLERWLVRALPVPARCLLGELRWWSRLPQGDSLAVLVWGQSVSCTCGSLLRTAQCPLQGCASAPPGQDPQAICLLVISAKSPCWVAPCAGSACDGTGDSQSRRQHLAEVAA